MKTVVLSDATTRAQELIRQAAKGPILVRDHRGRTYVLAEVNDADAEALSLANSEQLLDVVRQSRARAEREGWLTTAELREQLGL